MAVVAVLLVGGGDGKTSPEVAIPTATNVPAASEASRSQTATATPVRPTQRPTETPFSTRPPQAGRLETPRPNATTAAIAPAPSPTPLLPPSPTPLRSPTRTPLVVQPDATAAPSASGSQDSGPLRMLLVRGPSHPQELVPVSAGTGGSARVDVPVIFGLPETEYAELRARLWTPSSLIFTGDRFSGTWPGQPRTELVLQLAGCGKRGSL